MKRSKLAAAIGSALLLGSSGAFAGDPATPPGTSEGTAPNLDPDEKLLYVLTESGGSLKASQVEHVFNCAGTHAFSVSTTSALRRGTATVDTYNYNALLETDQAQVGSTVTTADGTNPAGRGTIGGSATSQLVGNWAFPPTGEIMIGSHDVRHDNAVFDEHVIKDIFINRNVAEGGNVANARIILDRGLEVITKKLLVNAVPGNITPVAASAIRGIPRSKWRQTSRYVQPDGITIGEITFKKARIAPNGAPQCLITVTAQNLQRTAVGFSSGAGSQVTAVSMGQIVPNP